MYAEVIVGLSVEKLDRAFSYRIPEGFLSENEELVGLPVIVPFGRGNREVSGYIIDVKEHPGCDPTLVKDIIRRAEASLQVERRLIELAGFIRKNFGGTMNDALRAVLHATKTVERKKRRTVFLLEDRKKAEECLALFLKKHYSAKARVLKEALEKDSFDAETFMKRTKTQLKVLEALEEDRLIRIEEEFYFRKPVKTEGKRKEEIILNEEQRLAVEKFKENRKKSRGEAYLLFGITGSGKTEVYIEMMREVIRRGKQVIFLIPEIALTYQMVERLSAVFGERISIMNSRMSDGERYDQYLRAKEGDIDIIVGPRSALFTPFREIGLLIVDEEHSDSYKSSKTPGYHAREVALHIGETEGADVILGSATPSLEAVKYVKDGKLSLLTLSKRPEGALSPAVEIIDLREELKAGNRSVLSERLRFLIEDRLKKKEQIMLFLNRRGFAGFVSCRSCGEALMCPHCAVSLTFHRPNRLLCHYCGHEAPMPKLCPTCGSPHIKTFGLGTEQVEEIVKKTFPAARVLRMDADTTGKKHSHEEILRAFKEERADILVGTQMIVKGHDFEKVTLVGVLAADLSLFAGDFRSAERTWQLLVQAAGRAGRGKYPGTVVIQTYKPDHYSITAVKDGDVRSFYEKEIRFRKLSGYPPERNLLEILFTGKEPKEVENCAKALKEALLGELKEEEGLELNEPVWAAIPKINDLYRMLLYVKADERKSLGKVREAAERELENERYKKVGIRFDFQA